MSLNMSRAFVALPGALVAHLEMGTSTKSLALFVLFCFLQCCKQSYLVLLFVSVQWCKLCVVSQLLWQLRWFIYSESE